MPSKTFHLGDLITVTTGRLVSPRRVEGVYDVVDFVTGQSHMTHQLPRASDEVKPELLRQHPFLADITVPDDLGDETEVWLWLSAQVAEHGEWFEVDALPEGAYVGREPVAEFREMAANTPIIAIGEPPADLDGGPQ